jgi:hypothetical protein
MSVEWISGLQSGFAHPNNFHNEIFIKVNAKTKDEDFLFNKNHHQDNLTEICI